jgi:hypothetical protein
LQHFLAKQPSIHLQGYKEIKDSSKCRSVSESGVGIFALGKQNG